MGNNSVMGRSVRYIKQSTNDEMLKKNQAQAQMIEKLLLKNKKMTTEKLNKDFGIFNLEKNDDE